MFGRIVFLLQTVAIIACPLWCGNGLCCGGQYRSPKQSSHQACSVCETARCCHRNSLPDRDNRIPCRGPNNSSCQGVCGGAVFEKPIELNNVADSFFLPQIDTEVSFVLQLTACRWRDIEYHSHCHGGNYGRLLRILHMSLLC